MFNHNFLFRHVFIGFAAAVLFIVGAFDADFAKPFAWAMFIVALPMAIAILVEAIRDLDEWYVASNASTERADRIFNEMLIIITASTLIVGAMLLPFSEFAMIILLCIGAFAFASFAMFIVYPFVERSIDAVVDFRKWYSERHIPTVYPNTYYPRGASYVRR